MDECANPAADVFPGREPEKCGPLRGGGSGNGSAVRAATDMVIQDGHRRPAPDPHRDPHGPVVFQDGDVYGSTVNTGARLSALMWAIWSAR
jgi:hypothetical protein